MTLRFAAAATVGVLVGLVVHLVGIFVFSGIVRFVGWNEGAFPLGIWLGWLAATLLAVWCGVYAGTRFGRRVKAPAAEPAV